ncbi:unnamed protein product [Rotaria sp. Silwood2]|nr:unnamed protein product [Rotaria sp. Silwood2]CAF3141802.1 unnamed protein product [Rotaria sp. Silwood2]CAF3295043.1 unnamed protein product [Rotaria sp. Silwood2]CAF4568217.1 unnamed protein product [Rotaria sp. Silwood2]CAF4607656.1 unnamed protein product [Rotaria sp. Silwood2]
MGLSEFEECSSSVRYCCPSIDRSLTRHLIELSNSPFKSFSRFSHRPEWADGLDIWSSIENSNTKNDLSRRHLDFHNDIGLYLPRHEKPNSAPISLKGLHLNSKITNNHFTPERIRQLLKKEKDLLIENNLSDQKFIIENPIPPVPTNTFRQSTYIESSQTNEIRFPLRHITSKSPSPPQQQQQQQQINPSLNQDTLKSLLKEHLTSLLTRGASTLNGTRTLINVPSVEIKQQNRTDSKLIEELNSSSLPFQQIKPNQTSPLIFHQRSTFGLTVTPVDLSSQKNFSSVSLEKMAQQKNFNQDNDSSSTSTSRPSTQPAPLPPSTFQYQQQQKVVLRRNLETTNSSSVENFLSNENLTKQNEQNQTIQNIRKVPFNNRSSSKTGIHRTTIPTTTTTTMELLPPIISGKRLHIPLANHRYL